MNLTELRAFVIKLLAYDLDSFDGDSPSDAQKDSILNWGLRQVGLSIYLYQDVPFTIVTSERSLRLDDTTKFTKPMLTIDTVVLNGVTLRDSTRRHGIWNVDKFNRWYPSAATASNGTPEAAVIVGNSLVFNCPVSDNWSGIAMGRALPQKLVSPGHETPTDIPEHLHECIAYFAAIKWAMPNATIDEQYQRLQMYSSETIQLLITEFHRGFKNAHGRDPEASLLREASSAFKTVERGADRRGSS
jgi:hypothetical protein